MTAKTATSSMSRLERIRQDQGALKAESLGPKPFQIIDIDLIDEDPQNERKTFAGMEDLIASARIHGILEPITVVPKTDGRFVIEYGHRRVRAARAIGLQKLRAFVESPHDEWTTRKRSIITNIQREDIPGLELANVLKFLLENDPSIKTQDDLALAIGRKKAWVSKALRGLTIEVGAQELLAKHPDKQSIDMLAEIARTPQEQHAALVSELIAGTPKPQLIIAIADSKIKTGSSPKTSRKPPIAAGRFVTKTIKIPLGSVRIVVTGANSSDDKAVVKSALEQALAALNLEN